MAEISISGISDNNIGNNLQEFLMSDDMVPGDPIGYALAKVIYTHHPMGGKMAETPVKLAMSLPREISIPSSPETMVKDAFEREWKALNIDSIIMNTRVLSRVYGAAAVIYGSPNFKTTDPIPLKEMGSMPIYFNVLDPLNVAGSLVLNQNPNAPDFQKATVISVMGQPYHFSRACTIMNEAPVYLEFNNAGFGYTGRSIYQRALFPLKTFITSMVANDEILKKAAVIVSKQKGASSIADKIAAGAQAIKRSLLRGAKNGNVLSIGSEDTIETLDLANVDKAVTVCRSNVIEDIASSSSIPPTLLMSDGYAGVLANGTEDFKQTMQYINDERKALQPLYTFFDNIVMHRAWNEAFFERVKYEYPEEYGGMDYNTAFYQWKNDFVAIWPSLMMETDEEKSKSEKVKLDAMIQICEKLTPMLDPENKAMLVDWMQRNINDMKSMFADVLELDIDALKAYTPPAPEQTNPGFGGGQ